jgi:hypothetical protein
VYVAEKEALLTVPPVANALLLVLRDEGVLRFVRYANHHGRDRVRWDLATVVNTAPTEEDL